MKTQKQTILSLLLENKYSRFNIETIICFTNHNIAGSKTRKVLYNQRKDFKFLLACLFCNSLHIILFLFHSEGLLMAQKF